MISVDRSCAAWAFVTTLGKRLLLDRATPGAFLTRSARIDRYGVTPSVCSFVRHEEKKHPPSGIHDRLSQAGPCQAGNIQFLKTDQVETIDQFA